MISTAAGWALPSLRGAILALEAVGMPIGALDRQLTMLARAGHLDGLAGVAVGQLTDCSRHGSWTAVDLLREHLGRLGVPILGGLPFGHGKLPRTLAVGLPATLDADAGTLRTERV